MTKYVVAQADEIAPGDRKILTVAERQIGVFNVAGEYFALRNRCPHQGGPLCSGVLYGALESRVPGEYSYSRAGEIIRCPWHGWEFDLRTGQSWFDPDRTRVHSYSLELVPGSSLRDDLASAEHRLEKGPYVVESYAAGLAGAYVVVEIEA